MKLSYLIFSILLSTPIYSKMSPSGYQIYKSMNCGGFPRVSLESIKGTCVGMVANADMGFKKPRMAIEVQDGFFVTDLRNWNPNQGALFFLEKTSDGLKPKIIFRNLDRPHGIALGPDNLVYVGEAGQIFRFDPKNPIKTKEIIIKDLPINGVHPLSYFIFDSNGDMVINVGAPSDQCLDEKKKPQYPCPYMEGERPQAALYRAEFNEQRDVVSFLPIATGLRNSMALVENPINGDLLQFENNMDFSEENTPFEEINIIKEGEHYGWPYCYEMGKLNKKYKRSFFNRRIPKIDCKDYQSPAALLPAHSAPLGAMYYNEDSIPTLKGKILVSLHGYRDNGHRLVSLDPNNIKNSKEEIISKWQELEGFHPKGAPVGLSLTLSGNILMVDDKNKNLLIMASSEERVTDGEVIHQETPIVLTSIQKEQLSLLRKSLLQDFNCTTCHSIKETKPTKLVEELKRINWLTPGDAENSLIIKRMRGLEGERLMPPSSEKVPEDLINALKDFINSLKK